MPRETIASLKKQLELERAETRRYMDLYADQKRQNRQRVEETETYKKLIAQQKALLWSVELQKKELDRLTAQAAADQVQNQAPDKAEQKYYIEIPSTKRKPGRKSAITDETRALIKELSKVTDLSGKKVNSLRNISAVTGISTTVVHGIVHGPEISGRWYSVQGGKRIYYPSYADAVRDAGRRENANIHFETIGTAFS